MYMVNQGKYYASLLLLLRYMSMFTIMYHVGPLCFKQQAQQRSALNHHTVASLEVFVFVIITMIKTSQHFVKRVSLEN